VGTILIVFLPILTLEDRRKLFKPMALTLIFALLGSLILALTLTPVLTALFLPKQVKGRSRGWCGWRTTCMSRRSEWRCGSVS
jgi:Cu/Ag efflux pump CusA